MVTTYIWSMEQLKDSLLKLEKNGFTHVIISLGSLNGASSAPSKKNPNYRISLGISKDTFSEGGLENITDSRNIPCALVLIHETEVPKLAIPTEPISNRGKGMEMTE